MEKICIVGVGLIGGSIGLDIKKHNLASTVIGVVRRKESIKESIELGAVSNATLDINEGVKDADMIILATPISKTVELARKIKTKAIVTDVASVKGKLVKELESIIGRNYVGTHPIAGSEKKGVSRAKTGLYKGAYCIITPTENTKKEALDKVIDFWKKLGSKIKILKTEEHDKLIAMTSHMPHLIAASLVNVVLEKKEMQSCIGPGFRDTTRIAASTPDLWKEICEWNKDQISSSLTELLKETSEIKELIDSNNWDELYNKLAKAKELREKL